MNFLKINKLKTAMQVNNDLNIITLESGYPIKNKCDKLAHIHVCLLLKLFCKRRIKYNLYTCCMFYINCL